MKRYDEIILHKLLDSLERREKPGKDMTASTRGIFYHIDRKHLPEYFDETSLAFQTIHEQLKELETKGLVRLYWRNDRPEHILEKVCLVRENIPKAYAYLKRKPKGEKEKRIIEICRTWTGGNDKNDALATESSAGLMDAPVFCTFLKWIMQRLADHRSTKQYADPDDPDGFEQLCRMLDAVERNESDRYLRELSIDVFRDSKTAEGLLEKTAMVFRHFGSSAFKDLTADEILEEFGIYRNPAWVYLKGYGRLAFQTGEMTQNTSEDENSFSWIDLQTLKEGIGLTGMDLELIRWDPAAVPDRIITIENLTAFHQWPPGADKEKILAVYLGGYASRHKCDLLQQIHKDYPEARYCHFGDIDCGGFRIWRALRERTGIPFETYRMDLDTLELYGGHGKPLSAGDRKMLQTMIADSYYEDQHVLFGRMLEVGIKLEQETLGRR